MAKIIRCIVNSKDLVLVDSVVCKNEIASFLRCEAMLIAVEITSEKTPKEMIFEVQEELLKTCVRSLLNVHHTFAP